MTKGVDLAVERVFVAEDRVPRPPTRPVVAEDEITHVTIKFAVAVSQNMVNVQQKQRRWMLPSSGRRFAGPPEPRHAAAALKDGPNATTAGIQQGSDDRLDRTGRLAGKAELGTNGCNAFDGDLDM